MSRLRRHRMIVRTARVLILVLFLVLWEVCANTGIIDSFIFSSPSRIALCFYEMVVDRSIFLHIGITLYETIVSFLLVTLFSILIAVLLWCNRKLSEILEPYLVVLNSPAEIRPCSAAHCLAGRHSHDHHRRRNVRCDLRKHHEPVYQLCHCGPGEDQTHLYPAWDAKARAVQSGTPQALCLLSSAT